MQNYASENMQAPHTNPLTFHLVNLTQIHISPVCPGDKFLFYLFFKPEPRVTETTDPAMYFGSQK